MPGASTATYEYDEAAVISGDEEAFEALVRTETPRLYRLIVRMLRDEDEARSVLQETFLTAYESLPKFRGESRLSTWLYGIALNQARAARRKLRRIHPIELADVDQLQPDPTAGAFSRSVEMWEPHRIAEKQERLRLVREAIDKLPDDYREVVLLRDMSELSTTEAAQILGLSEGALRVRLHRARQALRTLLEVYFRG